MSDARYDVVVAGLGAMGSQALWTLAQRGARVLGLDRHAPPHTLGSTHGETRLTRESAFEHERYVLMVRRAYARWAEFEAAAGEPILQRTGGLFTGPRAHPVVAGSLATARQHGVAHTLLDAAQARALLPTLRLPEGDVAYQEPSVAMLYPERAVAAALRLARQAGSDVWTDTPLLDWEPDGDGVVIRTARGRVRAGSLVLAAGPWMRELLAPLDVPLVVERITLHWFRPRADAARFAPDRHPVLLVGHDAQHAFAFFPAVDGRCKATVHHAGGDTTIDTVDRAVHPHEVGHMRGLLERFIPDAAGEHDRSAVCLYTNTASGDFLLDRHPAHPQVVLASPCSGFGFKFASAVGEILADLATAATPRFDLSPFSVPAVRARRS